MSAKNWIMGGCAVAFLAGAQSALSAERDIAGATSAAQSDASDVEGQAYALPRPPKMPDLTKGEKLPTGKAAPGTWNMGPTGIIGLKNAGFSGDQVLVESVLQGSPAVGKVLPGDVIIGIGGTRFSHSGHLGVTIGNAIIMAEEEAQKGLLSLSIWRDRNWKQRNSARDMAAVNMDVLMRETEAKTELYEWQGEKERKAAVLSEAYDKFPIDGFVTNITLQLKVMGTYSDTSPWDCPVAAKIREEAWKAVEATFKPNKQGRTTATWRDAIGLVASGKPEHRELVRQWVRNQKLCKDINEKVEPLQGGGMLSWHHGFAPLDMAIYYDATGDDYVLPEIRRNAIHAAMGQSGGGSWGHTFSFPVHNGGELHGRCPGYGGMNNAGTRCFFLLALARKAGIKDPEIDAAIVRSIRFFNTYVDKGCIPYGDHPPYPSDDSNGKNFGAAYAFYVLGMDYQAKYFAMNSAHAAFTPRGGHGSPVLWQYTPLSSHITGPKGVQAAMRNMRWFYTLARRHDASFVIQSEQEGVGAYGYTGASASALYAMYHSLPLKQLITTGKDANTNCWFTDKELDQLLVSARGQMNNPALLKRSGKPWNERSTQELFGWLGHFYPNMRRAIADELGKRYKAGQKEIAAKAAAALDDPDARVRNGGCKTLMACGPDVAIESLSKFVKLLDDPAEFVRMGAVDAINSVTQSGDSARELTLLKSACVEYPNMSTDIANVPTAVKTVLLAKGVTPSKLTTEPFATAYDKDLVRQALIRLITLDPGGVIPPGWTQETVRELAGPIVFASEELQRLDKMGMGERLAAGRAALKKYGYRELVESEMANLKKRPALERSVRSTVQFTMGGASDYGDPLKIQAQPSLYRPYLKPLKEVLQDDPVMVMVTRAPDFSIVKIPLVDVIAKIEAAKDMDEQPSLGREAMQLFERELAQQGGPDAVVKYCRTVLKNPHSKDFFRQMAAMSRLAGLLRGEALGDIVPYLGADQWRVREHAHGLAVELAKSGASGKLIALLDKAEGAVAAGMLKALQDADAKPALASARAALKHKDGVVRRAAVQTVMALGGDTAMSEVLTFLGSTSDPENLWGCELALLSRRNDPAYAGRLRVAAVEMLPKATPAQRRSLFWVIGQLGGPEGLAVMKQAAMSPQDDADLKEIVIALSYSPDRDADGVMLALAKLGKKHLDIVSSQAVRRMVGPNGTSDVTDQQRLDFAEPMLALKHEPSLITYLGKVHTGRSVRVLYEVMKNGSAAIAAPVIISAGDGMEKAPDAEKAVAADALTGVIEYIEVTKLRGGPSAHTAAEDNYVGWKGIQSQAGKVLLKIHKPKEAAIPKFDDKGLDI